MVESNFEYTQSLIKKVNNNAIKKYNLITEIAMFIIFLGACILFFSANIILGVIASVVFVTLLISLILSNLSIVKSNRILIGQKVNIVFEHSKMTMTAKVGERILYRANFDYNAITNIKRNNDLIIVHFNKISTVIIPKTSFKTSQDCQKALELMGNNYIV